MFSHILTDVVMHDCLHMLSAKNVEGDLAGVLEGFHSFCNKFILHILCTDT